VATDETGQNRRGPSDATDYSSTQAPETRKEAEEREPHPGDPRLIPGGEHGAAADPGMSSLDRDTTIGGAQSPGQQDFGSTADAERSRRRG
jgi:hypothetical protein